MNTLPVLYMCMLLSVSLLNTFSLKKDEHEGKVKLNNLFVMAHLAYDSTILYSFHMSFLKHWWVLQMSASTEVLLL